MGRDDDDDAAAAMSVEVMQTENVEGGGAGEEEAAASRAAAAAHAAEPIADENGDKPVETLESAAGGKGESTPGKRDRSKDPIGLPKSRVQNVASEVTKNPPNTDALFAITRATELLLEDLVKKYSAKLSEASNEEIVIEYDRLAEVIHEEPRLAFLEDIVPLRCSIEVAFPRTEAAGVGDDDEKEAMEIEDEEEKEEEEEEKKTSEEEEE